MADLQPLRAASAKPPAGAPLLVDARRLALLLCAGLRTLRSWDAGGKVPRPLRLGGRTLWLVSEINDWLAAGAPDRATWEAGKAARK